MRITSFNPMVLSAKADAAIELFESLGFERRHQKKDIDDQTAASVRLKDANGFHVDIVQVDVLPRDMTAIKMNVDDFRITDTGSSKSVMMVSPSGFAINLVKHIRKEDR